MINLIRELHQVLAGRVPELSKKLDTVTTAKEAAAVVREMQEFNHRVMLTGQLLFQAESAALARCVGRMSGHGPRCRGVPGYL
ncbi:MAG: hypothetical protein AAB074_17365 [Planctomycetota bacterium]